jgi:hypothetical protein
MQGAGRPYWPATVNVRVTTWPSRPRAPWSSPAIVRLTAPASPVRMTIDFCAVMGMREGWAWTPREWSLATVDTGAGDPSRASAAKGARYFAALTEKIASFLVEVATTDVAQIYEDHASS